MATPFDDLFNFTGSSPNPRTEPPIEKVVQIHGRQIDGTYYVRAVDIVALLELNRVLPKIAALLKKKVSS